VNVCVYDDKDVMLMLHIIISFFFFNIL